MLVSVKSVWDWNGSVAPKQNQLDLNSVPWEPEATTLPTLLSSLFDVIYESPLANTESSVIF